MTTIFPDVPLNKLFPNSLVPCLRADEDLHPDCFNPIETLRIYWENPQKIIREECLRQLKKMVQEEYGGRIAPRFIVAFCDACETILREDFHEEVMNAYFYLIKISDKLMLYRPINFFITSYGSDKDDKVLRTTYGDHLMCKHILYYSNLWFEVRGRSPVEDQWWWSCNSKTTKYDRVSSLNLDTYLALHVQKLTRSFGQPNPTLRVTTKENTWSHFERILKFMVTSLFFPEILCVELKALHEVLLTSFKTVLDDQNEYYGKVEKKKRHLGVVIEYSSTLAWYRNMCLQINLVLDQASWYSKHYV